MQDWLQQLSDALGVDPPSRETIEALLELARTAAHAADRAAAPISCWLIGTASVPLDQARAVIERLAHQSTDR